MQLNQLKNNPGATQKRKRVGRGISSGKGKTCGVGQKGQKSRTGVAIKGFEGGQMPIYMRLPKRGFTNIFSQKIDEVNLGSLQQAIDNKKLVASSPITKEVLKSVGLVSKNSKTVKLLAKGELTSSIEITVDCASAKAVENVQKVKGKLTLLRNDDRHVTEDANSVNKKK